MQKLRRDILVLGWFLLAMTAQAQEYHPLFNGKDLDGWVVEGSKTDKAGKTVWSVKEGRIVCQGTVYGFLHYERRQFGNFALRSGIPVQPRDEAQRTREQRDWHPYRALQSQSLHFDPSLLCSLRDPTPGRCGQETQRMEPGRCIVTGLRRPMSSSRLRSGIASR